MTAAEALRRYHAAETRLAEVEKLIEQWAAYTAWTRKLAYTWDGKPDRTADRPNEPLSDLLLERDRLQAESFKTFLEARATA